MSNCGYCRTCKLYNKCKCVIVDIYFYIMDIMDGSLRQICRDYFTANIILGIITNPKLDYIYEIYRTSPINLLNTIFFGLCKEWMLNNVDTQSYASMLKEKYPAEQFDDDWGSNALYKQRMRYFKKLSKIHAIDINYYKQCSKDRFNLNEFIFQYRFSRKMRKDNTKDCEQVNRTRVFSKDIFNGMYDYKLPKDNNYRIPQFKQDLEKIENEYKKILYDKYSYFDKCLYLYTFEDNLHYETAYKFVKYMHKEYPNMTEKEKVTLLFWETNLRKCLTEAYNLIKFPFLLDMDNYIKLFFDEYMDNKERGLPQKMPVESGKLLMHLTLVYHYTIYDTMRSYKQKLCKLENFHISECSFAEYIFQHHVGNGQHIILNKELDDRTVKDLWELFSFADTLEERLAYHNFEI